MDEDLVVLCQALYQSIEEEWTEMHERLQELCWEVGVKKAGQRIAGLGRVAWRKTEKEPFFSKRRDWKLPSTEGRHCGKGSYVSLGRVHDPWQISCVN